MQKIENKELTENVSLLYSAAANKYYLIKTYDLTVMHSGRFPSEEAAKKALEANTVEWRAL